MPALRARAALASPLLILAALFTIMLPLVTTRLYASDEVQYFAYLRSLWFDRDVSFENEYQHFYDTGVVRSPGFHETFLERRTETGRRITFATMGAAVLWSPFYAMADASVRLRRLLGDETIAADGYGPPYVAAVAYGSAVYGWLSLVLSLMIARRVLRGAADDRLIDRVSLGATIAIWIGTPLLFYMYIAPPMSHACSAFAVALFVLAWLHVRERWSLGGLVLLGALAALMAMVREQDAFVAIGPAIDWLWTFARGATSLGVTSRSVMNGEGTDGGGASASGGATSHADAGRATPSRGRLALNAIAGAAAFALAYTPQLLAYLALNGYPGPSRLVARKMNWIAPHAFGVLASPRHGLLFWTPLVALSLAGLIWLAWRGNARDRGGGGGVIDGGARSGSVVGAAGAGGANAARIALCALVIVAAQVYVAGSVESWTVAGAFGQRRFVGLTPLFVVGLAAFGVAVLRRTASRAGAPDGDSSFSANPSRHDGAAAIAAPRARWLRRSAIGVVSIAIWWNLGLMAQFGTGLMDRQRLELGRNAYHTFVTIPLRLPELVHRYVFARGTFYKKAAP